MSAELKVLIVEDCADAAALIFEELRSAGFLPAGRRIETESEFRRSIQESGWDVVLCDYLLPNFGAVAALKILAESKRDLPFIVVSGSASEETVVQVMKHGAHDYVLKDNLTRLGPAVAREIREASIRQARRRAEAALKQSETRLLLAQRIGQLGSWELDLRDHELSWSPETYRIFGVSPTSFQPTLESFYASIHPEDRERVREASERSLRERFGYSIDHRILRPDGTERHVHEQAELIFDEAGRPVQRVGTVQDITERKLLEAQLRQSQKMEAIGQLAGGVAHDFNNILTVILGYTDLVLCEPNLDPEVRLQVEQIAGSAHRASKLTRQLLAFSRKQPMQIRAVQLNDLIFNMAGMLRRLIGEHIELELQFGPDLPVIDADSSMLEQVVINLALNARDAMGKGGRLIVSTRRAEISAEEQRRRPECTPGPAVVLGIEDNGCGMDTRVMSRIFEPFFTTKEVGKGTGLGLSMVYGIVQQHQGWITVQSRPRDGARFEIFFPWISSNPIRAEPEPVQSAPASSGRETILLVEDEAPLRLMAMKALQRQGYRVVEAHSGPAALGLWRQYGSQIDLLLTDMIMPDGMTGRDLAVALQAEQPRLKVVFMSGYSTELPEEGFDLREGVNFIPKPYTASALCDVVRKCLDRVQAPVVFRRKRVP